MRLVWEVSQVWSCEIVEHYCDYKQIMGHYRRTGGTTHKGGIGEFHILGKTINFILRIYKSFSSETSPIYLFLHSWGENKIISVYSWTNIFLMNLTVNFLPADEILSFNWSISALTDSSVIPHFWTNIRATTVFSNPLKHETEWTCALTFSRYLI